LFVFNGNNTYVYQNIIVKGTYNGDKKIELKKSSNSKGKEGGFTEMVKKEHISNKLGKHRWQSPDERLKFSQIEGTRYSNIPNNPNYGSTC